MNDCDACLTCSAATVNHATYTVRAFNVNSMNDSKKTVCLMADCAGLGRCAAAPRATPFDHNETMERPKWCRKKRSEPTTIVSTVAAVEKLQVKYCAAAVCVSTGEGV